MLLLALSEADSPMLIYMIIGGLIVSGPAVLSWIRVIQYFRGEATNMSLYVTHDELSRLKAERDKQVADTLGAIRQEVSGFKREMKDDMEKFEGTAQDLLKEMMSLHRSLGRVEGHDEVETKTPRRAR